MFKNKNRKVLFIASALALPLFIFASSKSYRNALRMWMILGLLTVLILLFYSYATAVVVVGVAAEKKRNRNCFLERRNLGGVLFARLPERYYNYPPFYSDSTFGSASGGTDVIQRKVYDPRYSE